MLANCSSEPGAVPADGLPDLTGAEVLLATHRGGDPAVLAALGVTHLPAGLSESDSRWPAIGGSSWSR